MAHQWSKVIIMCILFIIVIINCYVFIIHINKECTTEYYVYNNYNDDDKL